ncbi:nucleotide disphospho-sugar-binding domain-containing protein [uncultured Massilia sp.]|uniref:glycosyltransferase n=1 Tax=uncultured Massilia sp. TaxID=169973 RepID=UPI0025E4B048|nr:nucleotide disphospho-sugar-binding domain-containing protein [uncultured Massilia sp.]
MESPRWVDAILAGEAAPRQARRFSRRVAQTVSPPRRENAIAPQHVSPPVHFVVATIGSAGDLFPFLALALALRARGHRVSFLAPEQHAPYVAPTGLAFTGLPADAAVLHDPDLWHPTRGFGVVWRATRPAMARIVPFVRALPAHEACVLLVHPLALPEAALCRADRPGLKVATAWLAPQNLPTVHDPLLVGPWRVPSWVPLAARRALWRWAMRTFVDPVALADVNAARAAHGLAPARTLADAVFAVPDLSLTLFPAWFAPTQPDWPQPLQRGDFPLYDPAPDAPLSAELQAFLRAGPAPLAFTHGTGNTQAAAYFRAALDAARQVGRRAILLTPHRDQLPATLPPGILQQDYVPLRRLLPHLALLAHHGGIGTTAEALRAGTPQLVVPLAHDQFDNAMRVAALGAGAGLPAARVDAARLARALARLLDDPAVAQRCRAVAARFDGRDAAAALAARLETLAGATPGRDIGDNPARTTMSTKG